MRILCIGNIEGWMEIHLRQMLAGFERRGCVTAVADYNRMGRRFGFLKSSETGEFELRQRRLEKICAAFQPDLILFAISRMKFDFPRLRSYYPGRICVWDYDGPNWKCYEQKEWLHSIDLLLTVSRPVARELTGSGFRAVYLPHGVDCDYYSPGTPSPAEMRKFGAEVSYVGRATARRARFCRAIADRKPALYGRRWRKLPECRDSILAECVRTRSDVIGRDIVTIYRASRCMINILQEPLCDYHTILSLQLFAIPATGTPLVAEEVEELADAFEPGREILSFRTPEEMTEQVERLLRDPRTAAAIGAAGRARCLRSHTHDRRTEELLRLLK